MDWSNEPYVRVYTRETDDDLSLSWEARALWDRLMTKFDRSGLVETKRGPRGLAAITRIPAVVIERVLPELLADGRLVEVAAGYMAPNFIAAQEAKKSDKLRQKESRDRRRAQNLDPDVTIRDENPGERHERSHGVTLCSADPDPLQCPAELPAPPPPPVPSYPTSQIHNPRTKLNHDTWQYAAMKHMELVSGGLSGSMPWPAMPAGAPMHDLVERVRECVDQANGDVSKAAVVLRRRIDVAIAESKREGHLKWFTPSRLWDSKSFYRAIEISPEDAAKPRPPRAGPVSASPDRPTMKTLG